jgi:hypothetical protein
MATVPLSATLTRPCGRRGDVKHSGRTKMNTTVKFGCQFSPYGASFARLGQICIARLNYNKSDKADNAKYHYKKIRTRVDFVFLRFLFSFLEPCKHPPFPAPFKKNVGEEGKGRNA